MKIYNLFARNYMLFSYYIIIFIHQYVCLDFQIKTNKNNKKDPIYLHLFIFYNIRLIKNLENING